MEIINHIWPHISSHPYIFLFLGMTIGGETFLLPAVYLAAKGTVNFSFIVALSALATFISDTVWYAIGRFFPLQRILSWKKFLDKRETYGRIFEGFKKHSQKFLFISKFIYGTRTIIQILSGSVKMPFLNYSLVNLAGILSYLLSISLVAFSAKRSLASFGEISYNEYVSVSVFICIVLIFHLCLKKWLGKKFLAQSSLPGTKNEQ